MKGQTTIELKNVKTGAVERYVDNNMMTNAIEDYFNTGGLINNLNVPPDDIVKTLLGGIILFDEELPENANLVFPPATANMIGNAVNGITSNDNVTEMGSYNAAESGWQNDGSYLQVFDFSTSQANGTIACVCLSSKFGAYTGFGNGTSKKRKANTLTRYGGSNENYQLTDYKLVRVDYAASTIEVISTDELSNLKKGKKLTIIKYALPLTKLNIKGTLTSLVKLSETVINIPDEYINIVDSSSGIKYDSDGNVYIYPKYYDWTSSDALKIVRLNTQNQAEVISLQNTLGLSVTIPEKAIYFEKGYMAILYQNKMYRVNLSDSSSIEFDSYLSTWSTNTEVYMQTNGRIFLRSGQVLNVIQGTVLPINNASTESATDYVDILNSGVMSVDASLYHIIIRRKQEYIASINNLENPVEKTADKTMKVSYRIMF